MRKIHENYLEFTWNSHETNKFYTNFTHTLHIILSKCNKFTAQVITTLLSGILWGNVCHKVREYL